MPNPPAPESAGDGLLEGWVEGRQLARSFFDAPPEQVARELLGKILVRRDTEERLIGRIVETEAYLGEHDPAAHAASGRTARNAVLYGPPGHAYVYSIYGLHYCINVSCLPEGIPGCVLLRALEPLKGSPEMRRNRGMSASTDLHQLASGPGKLCQAFGITRAADNGLDLTSAESPLGLVEDDFECGEVLVTPRIGIRKAADLPLRFFLAGHACVSVRGR
ncbi:MAG TPA: DNA-3-methyladenine glycosylase [Acidobacteriaceae bacterium]|nr:DNA-3-methyladenine glycosylase [Terriglobia bacterium]HVC89670.1 DNA-3-methyladenine glycosylase [Acidobacteriaceae bacterium]